MQQQLLIKLLYVMHSNYFSTNSDIVHSIDPSRWKDSCSNYPADGHFDREADSSH